MGEEATAAQAAKGGLDALRATEADRLSLLKKIGDARSSFVVTYITSFREGLQSSVRDDDVRVLERHVRYAKDAGADSVDLFICTTGGSATFSWDFLAMFREYLPKAKLGVIVPYWAFSAGSATALGADEIVMGPGGVLGPADAQVFVMHLRRRVSSRTIASFMDLVRSIAGKRRLDVERSLEWLTRETDPLLLGLIHRAAKEDERILEKSLLARRKPLSKRDRTRIMRYFLDEVGQHGQGIRRSEARAAGVRYVTDSEATGTGEAIERLFDHYAQSIKLFHPFAATMEPDQEEWGGWFDAYGSHSSETPVVLIESLFDTNAGFAAYESDRHWGAPPPISPKPEPNQPNVTPAEAPPSSHRPQLKWRTCTNTESIRSRARRD